MKFPPNFSSASMTRCRLYPGAGWLMRATSSSVGASIFMMGLSTFISASRISGMCARVALLSTLTFAPGQKASRSLSVSSIMRGNSGLRVGSPSPLKVMLSTGVPSRSNCVSLSSSLLRTSAAVGRTLSSRPSLFHPHSQ